MHREKVYKRQDIQRTSGTRRYEIAKAFDEAWRTGQKFAITMMDEGMVRVQMGRKVVAIYNDGGEFAKDFIPEILE